MKLLIITQKVNKADHTLGFFHNWLIEFAKQCEKVSVICLERGEYDLPANVSVYSLGKESGLSRWEYISRLFRYLWILRRDYTSVFVHMNPEYLVLAGWWWRFTGKKLLFWYTHRQVTWKLRMATFFAHEIFTASKKSFNLETPKLHVVGHGIDVSLFEPVPQSIESLESVSLVSVGRITRIKNLHILIEAVSFLSERYNRPFTLTLIGQTVTDDDKIYEQELRSLIRTQDLEDRVIFYGPLTYESLAKVYPNYTISINLAPTGGIDKAVLDAMAAGVVPVVTNEAFRDYFKPHDRRLMFKQDDAHDLADKLYSLLLASDFMALGSFVRERVMERSSLTALIKTILSYGQ